MPGVDPTPWTAWGVLGLLGLTVAVLLGIIWRLSVHQSAAMKANTDTLISFVNTHRGETATVLTGIKNDTVSALAQLGQVLATSNDRMVAAFGKQARALDQVLLSNRILDKIEQMKNRGTNLSEKEIERIVASFLKEHYQQRSTD